MPNRTATILSFHSAPSSCKQQPWTLNGEIAESGYFDVNALPERMGIVARTRIIDAYHSQTGVFRVFTAPDLED